MAIEVRGGVHWIFLTLMTGVMEWESESQNHTGPLCTCRIKLDKIEIPPYYINELSIILVLDNKVCRYIRFMNEGWIDELYNVKIVTSV